MKVPKAQTPPARLILEKFAGMPARTKKAARESLAGSNSSSSGSELDTVASGENGSEHESEDESSNGSGSGSEDGSDSDSLDSGAPRKRRRVSRQLEEDDEEDISKAPVSFISVPSRIKRNPVSEQTKKLQKASKEDAAPPVDVFGGATTAPTDPNTTFESLGVHPWLVQSLSNMAIKRPTGIQKGCIPEILKGKDCIGGSRTGSGKTVAFAVPILQKWAQDPSAIFAVVLTPTRYVHLPGPLRKLEEIAKT